MARIPMRRESTRFRPRRTATTSQAPAIPTSPAPPRRSPRNHKRPLRPYIYASLDTANQSRQIRLFELLPGAQDKPLSGTITTVNFTPETKFDALSYVWGDPRPNHTVSLQGNRFLRIASNLHTALVALRLKDQPRILWIDAICINQHDIQERGHQVQMMGDVYRTAHVVRVWIDVDVDLRSKPFRLAARIQSGSPSPDGIFEGTTYRKLRYTVKARDLDHRDTEFWHPIRTIFGNEYWKRVWTQQECFLARQLQFHFPTGSVAPEPLLQLYHSISNKFSHLFEEGMWTSSFLGEMHHNLIFGQLVFAKGLQGKGEGQPRRQFPTNALGFMDLFLVSYSLLATDPRDHVYGLMALAADIRQDGMTADYSMPSSSVYQQVARHYVEMYKSLGFLCHTSRTSDHSLPSWLPCFTKGSIIQPVAIGQNELERLGIPLHSARFDENTLTALGFHYQHVKKTLPSVWQRIPAVQWSLLLNQALFGVDPSEKNWMTDDNFLSFLISLKRGDIVARGLSSNVDFPHTQSLASRELVESFDFLQEHHPSLTLWDMTRPDLDLHDQNRRHFLRNLFELLYYGGLSVLQDGTICLCGRCGDDLQFFSREGDEVWVIFGCPAPLVLRPERSNSQREGARKAYRFIGHLMSAEQIMKEACGGLLPGGTTGPTYQGPLPEEIDLV